MVVQAYINFNGNCHEAVEYYGGVFGTEKPRMMFFKDMPPGSGFPLTDEVKDLVMHASLNIKGSLVMFSDVPPGMSFVIGNNISLIVNSKDMDEIKSLFNKLKEGGSVVMELQETFWSKCYGFVTDKFGIGWQFNYDSGEMEM